MWKTFLSVRFTHIPGRGCKSTKTAAPPLPEGVAPVRYIITDFFFTHYHFRLTDGILSVRRKWVYMEPEIHPNALKHLSREEVLAAWDSVAKSIQRTSDDEPPRWLMIGWLPSGASVELIAVETTFGWLVIHAMSPVQKKFKDEVERIERRTR